MNDSVEKNKSPKDKKTTSELEFDWENRPNSLAFCVGSEHSEPYSQILIQSVNNKIENDKSVIDARDSGSNWPDV